MSSSAPASADTLNSEPITHPDTFVQRHLGPGPESTRYMLQKLGFDTLDALSNAAVPAAIRLEQPLVLPPAVSESAALAELRGLAGGNQVFRSYIGMGYHDCITPAVLQRNILENPGWYTQYTPYQAEISQGRLEGLLTFQSMVCDLTGLDVANASLLDEATAAAEAMTMCFGLKQAELRKVFLVADDCHPQNIEVLQTRAQPLGIEVVVRPLSSLQFDSRVFGVLIQFPGTWGDAPDYSSLVEQAHAAGALVVVAADILSLTLLKPPGEFGADIAIGSAQRFGVPLGYGGPHAAYFATRDALKRHMPGRLVGVSKDSRGKPAFRLSLQTREQHIRREKATSNICTAQALLANIAAMYAVYHGPDTLRAIAARIRRFALALAEGARRLGHQPSAPAFDTLCIRVQGSADEFHALARNQRVNFRPLDSQTLGISLDETTNAEDIDRLLRILNRLNPVGFCAADLAAAADTRIPPALQRTTPFLTHPMFHRHRSETAMLRYLKRLESRDLSLTSSMIPLGSCTMKLNAAAQMLPITWPEFARLHPFAPRDQAQGYLALFSQLESWLTRITGFAACSLQPNAGSQGEYAGLLVIRAWHLSRNQGHRRICLIPTSAHGTNPASAVMAGFQVVPVACDAAGNIDVHDLRAKVSTHAANLAALMVTYPSTHGVFETEIQEVCRIVHASGGQVYMDGANLNAQVGLCRPGDIGADVCHINLHKTFCIPHGGGGPGMGPICVAQHLAPFLPSHSVVPPNPGNQEQRQGAVSAAPWGSASILPISWMYIRTMGPEGLKRATQTALLNANYIARRLENAFPVLYKGPGGLVAHECILDLRAFKSITVEDVAKRLMDFGFHAPTVSWPVAGTIMVEPTESEPLEELDRFCEAMLAIHGEITEIESGRQDPRDNPLKQAPHTADQVTATDWPHPYPREQAAFPAPWLRDHKFWPSVSRIDNVFGDRNPVCTCTGMEAYGQA